MAQLCNHCKKSTKFKVILVAEGKVDLKEDTFDVYEQGDLGIQDGSLVCLECGQPIKQEELIPGLLCAKCGTYHDMQDMVQLQNEDNTPGDIICNPCYKKMTAPTPESMTKEQLLEMVKTMQNQMAQMQQAQQAQVVPQQQQPMAQASQPQQMQQAPQQQVNVAQQPVVNTNIPAPENNIIDPSAIIPEEQPTGNVGAGKDLFGGEAPF